LATSAHPTYYARSPRRALSAITAVLAAAVPAAYVLGALALAGEAAVHIQQYIAIFHEVNWIGPLFLANAATSLIAVVGLAYRPTRQFAALAGVVISVVALGSLVVSYGNGLFGWREAGFRTPIAVALIAEVASVVLLSTALAASYRLRELRARAA
jgi:hypothetical protein